MAVNDDGTRFSCLAMARCMVATVVTVFSIVVIVMVITVDVLHPEEISLSILQGHVNVTDLWVAPQAHVGDFGRQDTPSKTVAYKAAKNVDFGLTLVADNPSGRANIYCTNLTILFFDMPGGENNFTEKQMLGSIDMGDFRFVVNKKSSHMLTRWQSIDKEQLSYLASTYGGRRSFTGAVAVGMNISSDPLVGHKRTRPRYVPRFCGPLTVTVVGEPSRTAGDVPCEQIW